MGLGVLLLLGYLALTGRLAGLGTISGEAWLWILVTGVLLAGYVATWFAALRETQATTVTSVLVLAAVVTGALSAAAKGSAPDPVVLAGYLLIVAGRRPRRSGEHRVSWAGPVQFAPSPTREPGRPAASGPVLFARYAYGPNRLGLCGPDDAESLFGQTTTMAMTGRSAISPAASKAPTPTWS